MHSQQNIKIPYQCTWYCPKRPLSF